MNVAILCYCCTRMVRYPVVFWPSPCRLEQIKCVICFVCNRCWFQKMSINLVSLCLLLRECNRNRKVDIPQRSWYNKVRSSPEGVSYYLVLVFCNHRVKEEAVGTIWVFEGLTVASLCSSSESHSARYRSRPIVEQCQQAAPCILLDSKRQQQRAIRICKIDYHPTAPVSTIRRESHRRSLNRKL